MKYVTEYRDPEVVKQRAAEIAHAVTRPWVIMEICGGQTHSIVRHGIDTLLPKDLELVHGPGCPVCVTAIEQIDRAHAIARRNDVIFCSFGDMLRVPGSDGDLFSARARGADVRIVYSPLDAVELAAKNPEREVVFFAIGFETTAPANATAVWAAKRRGIRNFSVLVSHVLVPPAMAAILASPGNRVQGFLGPGHVCAVMGTSEYETIAARHRVPIVISGFEPVDLLDGILACVSQLERGEAKVENAYARAVGAAGNTAAQRILEDVFEVCDRPWRGIGTVDQSGYRLRPAYRELDAEHRFAVDAISATESPLCIAGQILQGRKKPCDCAAFGSACTPETPLGATMVSTEGACAAYFHYRRHLPLASGEEVAR